MPPRSPFKILFKYPSRTRPERFFAGLDSIVTNLNDNSNYHISCTLDTDDASMNNPQVIDRIQSYKHISVTWGLSDSKIHAVNRNMPDWGDIIIIMSDDMRFNLYGFDDLIRVDMNYHFPDFDGLLHYLDPDTKGALATMYIAGRKFYDKFGYVYHPSYKSLWCDNEVQEVAQKIEKYFFTGYDIYQHLNPAYGHLDRDHMFNVQQGLWEEDEANFNQRKAINFEL